MVYKKAQNEDEISLFDNDCSAPDAPFGISLNGRNVKCRNIPVVELKSIFEKRLLLAFEEFEIQFINYGAVLQGGAFEFIGLKISDICKEILNLKSIFNIPFPLGGIPLIQTTDEGDERTTKSILKFLRSLEIFGESFLNKEDEWLSTYARAKDLEYITRKTLEIEFLELLLSIHFDTADKGEMADMAYCVCGCMLQIIGCSESIWSAFIDGTEDDCEKGKAKIDLQILTERSKRLKIVLSNRERG